MCMLRTNEQYVMLPLGKRMALGECGLQKTVESGPNGTRIRELDAGYNKGGVRKQYVSRDASFSKETQGTITLMTS